MDATTELATATTAVLRAERRRCSLAQLLVVVSALATVPPILLGPTGGAMRLSAVGAALAGVLLAWLVVVRSEFRLAALDAIERGHEDLPLAGVEGVRRHLLDPARQAELAASLRVHAARRPGWRALHSGVSRVGSPLTLAGAALELEQLAALLDGSRPSRALPVAACERLLIDGARSPLHGRDVDSLRDELARIRVLLEVNRG